MVLGNVGDYGHDRPIESNSCPPSRGGRDASPRVPDRRRRRPDWASWYGDWLINLSELPQILGATPVRSELVWLLVTLDKEYTKADPGTAWPQWYAERVVERFAADPR